MKYLIVLIGLLLIPVSSFSMLKKKVYEPEAGDPGRISSVVTGEAYRSIAFGGVRFPSTDGSLFSFGIGSAFEGSNLYLFNYTDIGRYGSVSSEVAYLFNPVRWLYLGPLAGPNVDWMNQSVGADPVTYLVGSAGAVVGCSFSNSWGVWGYGKYTFGFEQGTEYPDGEIFGFGLYFGI